MVQVIQLKRRVGTGGAPATLAAGEPAAAMPAGAGAELYIGDGSAVQTLVSATRQVEVSGDQTITGNKTISGQITAAPANLKISGGATGQVLSTDGASTVSWVDLPPGTVVAAAAPTAPDAGDTWFDTTTPPGTLKVWDGTAWQTAIPPAAAATVVTAAPITGDGSAATPVGLAVADTATIAAGTDNVIPITSAGLRTQLGADAATLTTTAKTIVPALNELQTEVAALTGALQLVGTYDVATDAVTPDATSGATPGPLPAAAPGNEGWYVIATTAGTGTGNAPAVAIASGDWLVSTGTAWVLVPTAQRAIVASNVGVNPAVAGANNVQAALSNLETMVNTNSTQNDVQNAAIALKADTSYVDAQNTAQNTAIAGKADTTYVDAQNATQDTAIAGKVNKAGDTMTGPLVLAADPAAPLEAATKQYVDNAPSSVSVAGPELTGNGLAATPITLVAVDGGTF